MLQILEIFVVLNSSFTFLVNNIIYTLSILLNSNFTNILYSVTLFNFLCNDILNFFNFFFSFFFNYYLLVKSKILFVNINLVYGLNSIHPFLFYISFITLLTRKINLTNFFFYIKYKDIILISIFTLLLGGFWGTTNSSWGFFWLNDSIEIVLLFICLILVYYLHLSFNYKTFYISYLLIFSTLLYTLSFRFGFFITRHNFFNINNIKNLYVGYILLFYKNINILILFYVFCFYIFFIFKKLIINHLVFNVFLKLNRFSLFFILLHSLIYIFIIKFFYYKENNLSLFTTIHSYLVHTKYFYFFNNSVFTLIFFLSKNIVHTFLLNNIYMYSCKLNIFFNIFLSYSSFFPIILLFLVLVSNGKIVPK